MERTWEERETQHGAKRLNPSYPEMQRKQGHAEAYREDTQRYKYTQGYSGVPPRLLSPRQGALWVHPMEVLLTPNPRAASVQDSRLISSTTYAPSEEKKIKNN